MKEPEKQEESKPDFEKIAEHMVSKWNYHTVDDVDSLKSGMEFVYNDFVIPLQSQLSSLKKENEELKDILDSARILINCINEYDIGEILPTKLVEEIESFLKDK